MNLRTLAVAVVLCAQAVAADPPVADFKIEAIELQVFDSERGEIEVMPKDGFNLFRDLLVKVKVSGPKSAFAQGRSLSVELVGLKTPAQKREVSGIGAEGTTYVLLYFPTGILCSPMTVRAKFTGQKSPSTKELKVTGFDCGE